MALFVCLDPYCPRIFDRMEEVIQHMRDDHEAMVTRLEMLLAVEAAREEAREALGPQE